MLGATTALVAVAPLALLALGLTDLLGDRRRLPGPRLYLFALQYAINDSAEILAAPAFGLRPPLARDLQRWSLRLLRRRADDLLGLRLRVTGLDDLSPGPVVAIARHVSVFDASLPTLLAEDAGMDARGVVMAELLADPGFDLIYGRLGSVFIPRDDGDAARHLIVGMVEGTSDPERTVYGIFPEGRLARPKVRTRQLERLAARDPERAERLGGLQRSLPPHPGGLWTLLEALPDADLAVLDHRGVDDIGGLADARHRVPFDTTVDVNVHRVSRDDIPADEGDFTRWLDALWLTLDGDGLAGSRRSGGPRS